MHGNRHDQLDDNAHPDIDAVPTPAIGENLPVHDSTSSQPPSSPPVVLLPRVREDRAGDAHTVDPCVHAGEPDSVGRRGVPVPVVLVPRSDRASGDDDPPESCDEDYSDEQHSVDDNLDGDPLSEDDLIAEPAEDATYDDGDVSAVATVVFIYSDGLFGISCVNEVDVKGLCLTAVPTASEAYGDLNDQYTWDVLRKALSDPVVDGVLWTPASGTYRDVASDVRPALRGSQGQAL